MSAPGPWWRRGGGALWSGCVLLLLLAGVNVWALRVAPTPNRQVLKFAPSHSTVARALLGAPRPIDELCVAMLGSTDGECKPSATQRFRSSMPPVARVGREYAYRPALPRPVTTWLLRGQPDGLSIDSATGMISGRPERVDRYDMTLIAQLTADSALKQSIALYVDDRTLWLGADRFGDDVFGNLLRSTRFLLLPGLVTVMVGVVGGVLLGAFAGFYGGPMRRVLNVMTAALQSIPGLLLVFVTASASDLNRWLVMIVVGLILAPETATAIAERVEAFRRREFVEAARELGLRDRTILWNEIVWHNARDLVMTKAAHGFVYATLMDVTLSYVGLLDAQTASLGGMLRSGRASLTSGDSSSELTAALLGVLWVVTTFMLLDRGIRRAWARPR